MAVFEYVDGELREPSVTVHLCDADGIERPLICNEESRPEEPGDRE